MKSNNIHKVFIAVLSLLVFSSCAQVTPNTPSIKNTTDVKLEVNDNGDVTLKKSHLYADGNQSTDVQKLYTTSINKKEYEKVPSFDKTNSQGISLKTKKNKNKKKKIRIKGSKVKVSVEEIPLNEFIDLMFSNVLQLNYTITEDARALTKPITLNMTSLESREDVYEVVRKILSINGIYIKKENGIFFLSKKSTTELLSNESNTYVLFGNKIPKDVKENTNILLFYSYKHITGTGVGNLLGYAGIKNVRVVQLLKSQQAFIGKKSDIKQVINLLEVLDKPALKDKEIFLISLENIEVTNFVTHLRNILPTQGISIASSLHSTGVFFIKINDINSLLVVSQKKSWLDNILYWKNKLDVPTEKSKVTQFYTYKVRNRKADELATALNKVVEIKLSKTPIEKNNKKKSPKDASATSKDHSIKFDLPTNTLMMKLLPSEYRELLPLIEKLDALPLQVLVEVTLAEVTLTDTFNLGFEYALRNSAAAANTNIVDALISTSFGGAGFAATYNSKNLDITINAYAEDKLLSIMSKPKLLILNNETGNINVGTQIPIITSETSASDIGGVTPSINRNISYRNTGIVVGLSPTINSNGILTLNINLQLSEAQLNDTSGIDSPLIVNRTLNTTLTLKHGETVMLGGLISRNKSTTDSGVPYLMDIPFIGAFFKSQSEKIVKTELIMLIKPFIIENSSQLSVETRNYTSLLKILKVI